MPLPVLAFLTRPCCLNCCCLLTRPCCFSCCCHFVAGSLLYTFADTDGVVLVCPRVCSYYYLVSFIVLHAVLSTWAVSLMLWVSFCCPCYSDAFICSELRWHSLLPRLVLPFHCWESALQVRHLWHRRVSLLRCVLMLLISFVHSVTCYIIHNGSLANAVLLFFLSMLCILLTAA